MSIFKTNHIYLANTQIQILLSLRYPGRGTHPGGGPSLPRAPARGLLRGRLSCYCLDSCWRLIDVRCNPIYPVEAALAAMERLIWS